MDVDEVDSLFLVTSWAERLAETSSLYWHECATATSYSGSLVVGQEWVAKLRNQKQNIYGKLLPWWHGAYVSLGSFS